MKIWSIIICQISYLDLYPYLNYIIYYIYIEVMNIMRNHLTFRNWQLSKLKIMRARISKMSKKAQMIWSIRVIRLSSFTRPIVISITKHMNVLKMEKRLKKPTLATLLKTFDAIMLNSLAIIMIQEAGKRVKKVMKQNM